MKRKLFNGFYVYERTKFYAGEYQDVQEACRTRLKKDLCFLPVIKMESCYKLIL